MQIDLKTVAIEPRRDGFDHLKRRFGDKAASRYQEASYDIQPAENFHYRPTWDPKQELYDPTLTKIEMADWYAFADPRQYYYHTYTIARSKLQERAEAAFTFVQSRQLLSALSEGLVERAAALLVPLRHVAWASNMGNTFVAGYGYGVTFTQPCMFASLDQLSVAQYLSRIGLELGGKTALEEAKEAWMSEAAWQPLRRLAERSLVTRDPFELLVALDFVLDGLIHELVYARCVDGKLAAEGGAPIGMMCQVIGDLHKDGVRWVDATLKTAASESEANATHLSTWIRSHLNASTEALEPVIAPILGDETPSALAEAKTKLEQRAKKAGVPL